MSPYPWMPQPGTLRQLWVGPSLLASLAMMAFLDSQDAKLLTCSNPKCNKVFYSNAYQVKFCSTRCKNLTNQQTFRDTQKVKRTKGKHH